MEIVDRTSVTFNRNLEWCKFLGLGIFCVGGSLLAAALLLPSLVGLSCLDDDLIDESTPFKVRISSKEDDDPALNGSKIPATEEVKSIQPKREHEEAIVTGTGLTKLK